jgi:hypothetical protein
MYHTFVLEHTSISCCGISRAYSQFLDVQSKCTLFQSSDRSKFSSKQKLLIQILREFYQENGLKAEVNLWQSTLSMISQVEMFQTQFDEITINIVRKQPKRNSLTSFS